MRYRNVETGAIIELGGSTVNPVWVPLESFTQAQETPGPVEPEPQKKRGRQKKG